MNKKGLIPRMALQSIRKNGSTYLPYVGVCIIAMFTYFVFDLILNNKIMASIPKAAYATMLMYIGFFLLGIIMVPFLYYTNSFLIKRRKKELGLYSILGMEKKHIGMMMFVETAVIYVVVEAAAMGLGLLFSRLLFLFLLNLAKLPVQTDFSISVRPFTDTLSFFGIVSLINLTANLYQVGKARPIELMSESRKGEKEPKHILLWSIAGALTLGAGYRIAIRAQLNAMIFTDFFLAVFLVVVGTYFLFTSGSIAFLRFVKRRKKFYYKAENFVTVSGMLYRMKKNAASLVNICIFGTMVIITAVCTISLYLGIPGIRKFVYPFDMQVNFTAADFTERETFLDKLIQLGEERQVKVTESQDYVYVPCPVEQAGNGFVMRTEGTAYQDMYWVNLITLDQFKRLEGAEYTLYDGEVLIYSTGPDFLTRDNQEKAVNFGEQSFTVKEELSRSRIAPKAKDNTFGGEYTVVVKGEEVLEQIAALYGVDSKRSGSYKAELNVDGEEADVEAFAEQARQLCSGMPGFVSFDYFEERIQSLESMYGGLLFIGVFFALIFLICLLVIMYYKQVSEGFEDQSSFEIMQKVGMSDKEMKSTIKKQILLVFFLPLVGAFFHTAVGANMVIKLLGSIGLFDPGLVIASTVGVSVVFALVYIACYHSTARTYYRIVRWK